MRVLSSLLICSTPAISPAAPLDLLLLGSFEGATHGFWILRNDTQISPRGCIRTATALFPILNRCQRYAEECGESTLRQMQSTPQRREVRHFVRCDGMQIAQFTPREYRGVGVGRESSRAIQ